MLNLDTMFVMPEEAAIGIYQGSDRIETGTETATQLTLGTQLWFVLQKSPDDCEEKFRFLLGFFNEPTDEPSKIVVADESANGSEKIKKLAQTNSGMSARDVMRLVFGHDKTSYLDDCNFAKLGVVEDSSNCSCAVQISKDKVVLCFTKQDEAVSIEFACEEFPRLENFVVGK